MDFRVKRAPPYRVASITRIGPWREDNLRAEFRELTGWTRTQGIRTGQWIFFERGAHRWEACLELKRPGRPSGRIRIKTLPAARVAALVFDPDRISSRIVYHALRDWTRVRRNQGDLPPVTSVREVYTGDPWNDRDAWANCEVQFLLRS